MNELVSPVIGLSTALGAKYMSGFGNTFETEALPGALPVGRNSPQKVNYGLYAEQLTGAPFTGRPAARECAADRAVALGSDADPGRKAHLRHRPANHDHGRRLRDPCRHGG